MKTEKQKLTSVYYPIYTSVYSSARICVHVSTHDSVFNSVFGSVYIFIRGSVWDTICLNIMDFLDSSHEN